MSSGHPDASNHRDPLPGEAGLLVGLSGYGGAVTRPSNAEPPIELADLPEPLANVVRAASDTGLWDEAIATFEDWLDEHEQRSQSVLAMLAFMTFRDALEVMVDEITERGKAALALLDKAALDTARTRELRRQIERALELNQRENARTERMRDRSLKSLDRAELRALAYKLGESEEREDHAKAAQAWIIASTFEASERQKKDCLARAALDFAAAGDWGEATPRLHEILAHPSDYDDWFADFAWYCFLDKAVEDDNVSTFRMHWEGALAMPRADRFPFAWPEQEYYLEFSVRHRLVDIVKHLVEIMTADRSPRERKSIAGLLDRAQFVMNP
jgi:hypothetical protein